MWMRMSVFNSAAPWDSFRRRRDQTAQASPSSPPPLSRLSSGRRRRTVLARPSKVATRAGQRCRTEEGHRCFSRPFHGCGGGLILFLSLLVVFFLFRLHAGLVIASARANQITVSHVLHRPRAVTELDSGGGEEFGWYNAAGDGESLAS